LIDEVVATTSLSYRAVVEIEYPEVRHCGIQETERHINQFLLQLQTVCNDNANIMVAEEPTIDYYGRDHPACASEP
jgi:hypothetical protein